MESLTQKLKNSLNFTLVLGFLSLTWLIIDYFVIETILSEGLDKFSLEWILLVASGFAFIVFHISVFITIYYGFRVIMRYKSEMKRIANNSPTPKDQESQN